MLVKSAVKIIS
ncbi:hypothetical protein vcoNHCC006C_003389A, partial [Vibrio cholerae O1 str. NHCC-006C]